MKKIIYIIIGIILLLIFSYIGFVISIEKLEGKAYAESLKIIEIIEKYYNKHGKYPEALTKELKAHNISQKITYGVISTEITVQFHNNYFEVYYYQQPLGPFHGYNSQNKEWSYFE